MTGGILNDITPFSGSRTHSFRVGEISSDFSCSHLDKYPLSSSSHAWLSRLYQVVLLMTNTSMQEMWPIEI
jgi:hypothetical protein